MVEIKGVNKAALLAELYRRAQPGNGDIYRGEELPMELAEKLVRRQMVFRFLMGHSLKVDISGDLMDEEEYDRSNGRGTAGKAVRAAWARRRVNRA